MSSILARLEAWLHELHTVTRPQMIEQLQDARSAGDMIDNTEYLLLENGVTILCIHRHDGQRASAHR